MKRISMGLVTLGLIASLGAYGAMPTSAAPFQVTIPNLCPGWEFNLTALYVRPSSTDEDYTVVTNTEPDIIATYNVKTVDPDYNWAVGVGLGYIFPDSGNDIRADWIHFISHNSTSSIVVADDDIEFVGPPFATDFDDDYNTAYGSEEFHYDAVDLDVGQFVNLGTRLQLRLFGGLRYAHIERDFDTTSEDSASFDVDYLTDDNNSKFDGIGPLFGVDSHYHISNCWGLAAHFDTALLVGDVSSEDTLSTGAEPTDGVIYPVYTSNTSEDLTRVVPGFDAKLGIDWSMPFACDSWFTAELGYQVTKYIDVFDRHQPAEVDMVGSAPITLDSSERVTSDFAFDGPYLSLNLKVS